MRRILAVLSIGALGIAGASAQGLHAVRPIPGYACMMPKLGDVRSFADLPRIMEYPDPASKPVGLAGTIVLARNPAAHRERVCGSSPVRWTSGLDLSRWTTAVSQRLRSQRALRALDHVERPSGDRLVNDTPLPWWRTVFTTVTGYIDSQLFGVMDGIVANDLAWVATWLIYAAALVIVGLGISIAAGWTQAPAKHTTLLLAKIGIVIVLVSQATYTYWIRDLIVVALPNDLAQVGGQTAATQTHAYDVILNAAVDTALTVWTKAGWSLGGLGLKLLLIPYFMVAGAAVLLGYGIWLLAHIMAATYISIGAVFVALFLFSFTRPMFSAWIGSTLSAVVLQLLSIVVARLTIGSEQMFLGSLLSGPSASGPGLIGGLFACGVLLALCGWFAGKLPVAAAALCGGAGQDLAISAGRSGWPSDRRRPRQTSVPRKYDPARLLANRFPAEGVSGEMKAVFLASLLALAACASHEAPQATGQWHVLNAGQWDIDPAHVTVPELPKIVDGSKD